MATPSPPPTAALAAPPQPAAAAPGDRPDQHVSDWLRLIQLTFWSLLLSVFVAIIVNTHDQALDATRALAATEQITTAGRLGVGVMAAALCTLVIWRTARQMQLIADGHAPLVEPGRDHRPSLFNRHYPRILACIPPASLAWQYGWLSAEVWGPLGDARFITLPWLFRVLVGILGPLIALLLVGLGLRLAQRRKPARRDRLTPVVAVTVMLILIIPTVAGVPAVTHLLGLTPPQSRLDFALILAGHSLMAWVFVVGFYWFAERRRRLLKTGDTGWDLRWMRLQRFEPIFGAIRESRGLVIALTAILVALLVIGVFWRNVGVLAGPIAVIYIALAIWTGIGNAVILLGTRIKVAGLRGLPIWGAVIAGAIITNILFSYGMNAARTRPIAPADPLQTAANESSGSAHPDVPDGPILIIAAEGGGIYAAYHAATFLAGIEQHTRDLAADGERTAPFSHQIYAMTGVSGGSVGIGVFTAALPAAEAGAFRKDPTTLLPNVKRILANDFLSPLLTGLFGRNLLPIFCSWADRTRALENALVDAWQDAVRQNSPHASALWRPLADLARDAGFGVMLNTTRVGDGRQYHIASFDLHPRAETLHPALTYASTDRYLPAVTALFVSARFPYVTPTARIPLQRTDTAPASNTLGFFVDGGYHENTGAAGALAIATDLRARFPDRTIKVLQLRALELDPSECHAPTKMPPRAKMDRPARGGELIKPFTTIVNTRSAHSERIHAQLRELVGEDNILHVCIGLVSDEGLRVPLGWVLSDETRRFIDDQTQDPERFDAVLDWLDGQ